MPSNLDTGIQAGHFHSDLIYLPVPLEQSYSKALCFSELKITDREKITHRMGENTYKSCVSDRDENPRYIKNSYNSTVKKSFL